MSVAGKARHSPTSLELIYANKRETTVLHALIRDAVSKPGTASSRPIGSAFAVPGSLGNTNVFTEPIALNPKAFIITSDAPDTIRIDKTFGKYSSRIIVTGEGGAADNITTIIGKDDGEGNTGKAAFAGQILNIEAVLTTPLTLIDGADIATPGGASFLIRGGSNVTLIYDSTLDKWKFLHDALVQRLDELLDVTIGGDPLATGHHLEFTGAVWENKADITLVSGGADLINLDDISFVNGHFLSQGTAAPHLNLIMSGDTTFRIGANTFGIVDFSDNAALGLKMLPNADIYMQDNQLFFDSPAGTRSIVFDGVSSLDYKVPAANNHRFFAGVAQRFGITDANVVVDTVPLDFGEITIPSNPAANFGRFYAKDVGGTHSEPFWLDELGTESKLIGTSFIGFAADADLDMNTFDIFDLDILQFGLLATLLLDTDVGITSTTSGDMQFNILDLQGFTFTHENQSFILMDHNANQVRITTPNGGQLHLERVTAPAAVATLAKFSGNVQLSDPVETNLAVALIDIISVNSTGADFNALDIQNLGNLLFDEIGKNIQADANDMILNTAIGDGFLFRDGATTMVDLDLVAFRIGTMYYQLTSIVSPGVSGAVNVGRIFQDSNNSDHLSIIRNAGIIDLEAGGSQTPILQDVDYDGFDILDLSNIEFRDTTGAPAASARAIHADTFGIQHLVPATQTHEFFVGGNLIGFFTETAGGAFDIGLNDIRFDNSNRFIDFSSVDNGIRIEHPSAGGFQFNLTWAGALEYDFNQTEFDVHANSIVRINLLDFNTGANQIRANTGGLEIVCDGGDDFEFIRGTSLLMQLDENELDLASAIAGIDVELTLNNGELRWSGSPGGVPKIYTAGSSIFMELASTTDFQIEFGTSPDVTFFVTPDGMTGSGNAFIALQKVTTTLEAVLELARLKATGGDSGGRIARVQGVARNAAAVNIVFGEYEILVDSNVTGAEKGEVAIPVRVDGGFTDAFTADSDASGTIPRIGFRGVAPQAVLAWSATGAGAPDRTVTTTDSLAEVAQSLVTLINDLEAMGILG